MSCYRFWFAVALVAVGCTVLPVAQSQPQPPKLKGPPKLEPVAETKLLMEGLADPNVRALGKLLSVKPKDAETWRVVRGQALLIAETGNLLMIRPPKTKQGQEAWMAHATELRENAAGLAQAAAAKDFLQARTSLAAVANSCNRCHQTFRVAARVDPFANE
ncbi:MAG: cytochrome c [Planctomycetia bacterium]|nr:cytochrome c [Planctomycetia bacterium]